MLRESEEFADQLVLGLKCVCDAAPLLFELSVMRGL